MINKIILEAKTKIYDTNGCHDWNHIRRVLNQCIQIGKKEKANLKVLKLAAILHDIGRIKESNSKGRICHAKRGAILAQKLLQKYKIDNDVISKVVHCIETHRFRGKQEPMSKEAKILFDADKLDSIGAVGIGRAFLFAGQIGALLHNGSDVSIQKTKPYTVEDTAYREYSIKLKKIKDKMFTHEGRCRAKKRHKYMTVFFKRMAKEIQGKI